MSIGRTATKWLAARLRVPHEPKEFTGRAVSPRHLYLMAMQGWKPPVPSDRIAVLLREPRAQIISKLNRAQHVPGANAVFQKSWRNYLHTMERLVKEGAAVFDYESYTTREGLVELASYFDVEPEMENFDEKLNQFEGTTSQVPMCHEEIVQVMKLNYDDWRKRWLTAQGT